MASHNIPNNAIIQWNCRSLYHKRYDLLNIKSVIKPIAICLQEIFFLTTKELDELQSLFKEYLIYIKNRERPNRANPRGGVAIFIHKTVPHVPLQLQTTLEAIAINVKYRGQEISICSLYLPNSQAYTVQKLTELSAQLKSHHLILGDFNAKHTMWGSDRVDHAGEKISDFILTTDNVLLNTGEPTRVDNISGNLSHIDISLASPRLSLDIGWYTYTDTLGSDHLPIILTIGADNIIDDHFTPLCKYKTKNVDWSIYSTYAVSTEGEDADEKCASLKNSILDAAETSLPRINLNRYRTLVPWWKPECKIAIKARNRAYKFFFNNPSDENFIEYKKCRAIARRVVRAAKKESWQNFVSKITEDTPASIIWDYIKRLNGKNFIRPLYLKNGNLIIDDEKEISNKIASHFASVSSDENYSPEFLANYQQLKAPLDFNTNNNLPYNADFTIGELLYVLGKVRGSSAGPDGIKYEMLQYLSPANKIKLLEFFNYLWLNQKFPSDWSKAITVPIHKPGKDPKSETSYRPIALTNVLCKVMERLVNRRLISYLERQKILHPMQSGFRKGRNTLHNLLLLEHDIKKSLASNNFTTAVFLDIEKAFDMCPREGILKKLHNIGLRGNLPIFIKNFLETRLFRVKVGNTLSDTYCQKNGVPQGSVLSPTLFILMINDLMPNPPPGVKISLYADDVVIWIESEFLNICINSLQSALNILQNWSVLWGLRFSPNKTKAMIFMRPQLVNSNRYGRHPLILKLYGRNIQFVKEFKYLGLYFDTSLTWTRHIKEVKEALQSKINILKAINGVEWGADRHTIIMLYKTIILSKIAYGCQLYSSAANSSFTPLKSIQNKCLRIATGALKCSKIPILEVESNVYPLHMFFLKQMFHTASTILSTTNHPLQIIINDFHRYITAPYHPFSTRTHLMALEYSIPLDLIEQREPIDTNNWEEYKNDIHINSHIYKYECPLKVLQESRIIINNFPALEPFYTDGSKIGEKVGSGIFSRLCSKAHRIPNGYSIFDAEAYAILSAINFIVKEQIPSVIFSDSQSALKSIKSGTSNHPIIIDICNNIIKANFKICIAWIPSHIGIKGNEKADLWAKQSLRYHQITITPISQNTIKRMITNLINKKWQQVYDTQNYNEKVKRFIGNFKTESRKIRREEIALCRIRTGKTLLTHTIPIINNVYPPICDDCDEILSIDHILINCLTHYRERREICKYFNENDMLPITRYKLLQDNEELIDLLIKYLRDTALLKQI